MQEIFPKPANVNTSPQEQLVALSVQQKEQLRRLLIIELDDHRLSNPVSEQAYQETRNDERMKALPLTYLIDLLQEYVPLDFTETAGDTERIAQGHFWAIKEIIIERFGKYLDIAGK